MRNDAADNLDAAGVPARARPTVLVVDDNVDAAGALGMLLELAGFSVVIAHDGAGALARAADARPEIVLLDLGLPIMDGYDVAARLRSQPRGYQLAVVAVSGFGPERDRVREERAHFDYHLVKPIDCEALLTLLNTLSQSRGRASLEASENGAA
jgi:CheY-like chemotaxis protein